MSSEARDILTWIVLAILGGAIFWFWKGARDADWVFSTMAGADRSIRNRITWGKRLLMASAVSFFACIQALLDLPQLARSLLFVLGCILMAEGAFFISRGYSLWRKGIQVWFRRE